MEIHERFMKLPTTGINVLETFAGNRDRESQIIRDLVEAYNEKISNNVLDLKTLETFRMILCYKYQSLIRLRNGDEPLKYQGQLYTDLMTLFIKNKEYRKTEEFSILYDIIVLQLVLFDKLFFRMSLRDFSDTEGLLSNTENIDLAMRFSECFADSYNLHTYLYKLPPNYEEIEKVSTQIVIIILRWLSQKESLEWKLLASLLPKLTITFEPQEIVSPLWVHIFGCLKILPPFSGKEFSHITHLEEKLGLLCVMADVCFPSEREKVKEFHYEQCLQNEFWCILNLGLISKELQQRKQALYLIKRALEFVDIHKSDIKKRLQPLERSAMPFVCTKAEAQESSLEEIKKSFFLILEVLEEKQKHLVLPALSHLPSLVKVQTDHESCCNCFNPIWLRCIYRRIVQHDNESVKIFGLQEILKSDPHIFFDEEFLIFFVDALNNTFLYDYNDEDKKPQIVKLLEESFLKWEQEELPLINSFVRALASISWGPVAIYWIIQALLAVTEQCKIVTNVWGDVELNCVQDLIQTSLMTHNLQLRNCSQVLIIRTFIEYTSMPVNFSSLEDIFNILCSFPDNVYLKHGSNEWCKIAKHLSKIIKPSDAVQYVTERCEKMFMITQSLKSFALIIRLLADSELIFNAKSCLAEKALRNVFQNLVGADLRPYADKEAIMKVIEFSGHLMTRHECGNETAGMVKIDALMTLYVDEILKIVCRSLEGKAISKYDEYLIVITALLERSNKAWWFDGIKNELYHIEYKCVNIITNPHNYCRTQWSYAIKVLYIYRKNTLSSKWKSSNTFILPLLTYFRSEVVGNEQEQNAKGKFASDSPETIAQLLYQCIKMRSEFWPPNVHWIENFQAIVETGNEHAILPVVTMLDILLDRIPALALQDLETINSIVRVSWRSIFQLKKTPVFFHAVEGLIKLITSEAFQKLDGSKEFAVECIDQMMQEAESVPLLKRILLDSYSGEETVHSDKAFVSCLLHGAVPRRDQRIERAAISHDHKIFDGEQLLDGNIDITIRAMAIQCMFCAANKPECRENILNMLLEILEKNKNKRYFDNSHLHRLKQRVMQALLELEPYLNELEKQRLYDALCDLLIEESNQPSVRLIHEWLLIRLYLQDADMRETIWKLFDTAAQKRPGSIISLASVVFHVARSLSEQTQKEYILKAISRLLPNCMGQQFNVRLYSQAILVKIYKMLPSDSSEAKTYKGVFESVEESLRRGNMVKNSTKVLDDFYFTIFDPVVDYNFETIYYHLPRLTNVSTDELIPAFVFEKLDFPKEEISCEKRSLFRTARPSGQSSKPTGELDEFADSSIPGGLSDIQKKIIPWKTMIPFYDDLSEISKEKLLRRQTQNKETGIVVVASLIDRPPNLGGIARTCEIFGAKELVIGSLRYAEDREFQTLSVSAEKWITITEVKPHLLQNYLLEKQSDGWKLVGAEQTANSTNLLEMVFPKKTILLLGNEKDGIPANLIPLLDTCVEIPQNGVVRSLNVHVTGAICIWEYAKQHLLT